MSISTNNWFSKDPDSKLDYDCDWSAWLQSGETITSAVWIVPAGLVQEAAGHSDTVSTIWLSGGIVGRTYEVVTRVTTSQERIEDQTQTFYIQQR